MTTDQAMQILLIEIHGCIAESAASITRALGNADSAPMLAYPPGAELSPRELEAIRSLKLNDFALSAMQKLYRDATARCFFKMFTLMDGVGDPAARVGIAESENWRGVSITTERPLNPPMLHDRFFDTYRSFMEGDEASAPSS